MQRVKRDYCYSLFYGAALTVILLMNDWIKGKQADIINEHEDTIKSLRAQLNED